jgi:hypothetical protein
MNWEVGEKQRKVLEPFEALSISAFDERRLSCLEHIS